MARLLAWLGWRGGAALILAGLLALTAWSWHGAQQDADAARIAAALAQDQARQHAAAVEAVQAAAKRAIAASDAAASAAQQRAAQAATIAERIAHAPLTRGCVDSPAVRAVLDGLRQQAAPAHRPDPGPAGAGGPAGLPSPPPAAGPGAG